MVILENIIKTNPKKLLDRVREIIRIKQYSQKTEHVIQVAISQRDAVGHEVEADKILFRSSWVFVPQIQRAYLSCSSLRPADNPRDCQLGWKAIFN